MSKVYIAAPFFNKTQLEIVENIKNIIRGHGVEFFSPKDESLFRQGDEPKEILDLNCKAIDDSKYIIVVTDDKDVGTIWEAGYAYAKGKPILYLWLGYEKHMKFNIMLAASGEVANSYLQLSAQIEYFESESKFYNMDTEGMTYE